MMTVMGRRVERTCPSQKLTLVQQPIEVRISPLNTSWELDLDMLAYLLPLYLESSPSGELEAMIGVR